LSCPEFRGIRDYGIAIGDCPAVVSRFDMDVDRHKLQNADLAAGEEFLSELLKERDTDSPNLGFMKTSPGGYTLYDGVHPGF
jgi:hypothetical protein